MTYSGNREEDDTLYSDILGRFDDVVSASTALSQGSAGIRSRTGRHYWASVLFTRLSGNGVSLLLLLPRNRFSRCLFENWDFAAVASLARNLCESYFAYFYLCVDDVPEEEWDCRWNILNIHDCLSRIRMFQHLQSSVERIGRFEKQAAELHVRLQNNSYFVSLPRNVQSRCLKGKKPYLLSQDEILERAGFDASGFRALYILWSAHIHSFPLGYYRTGEDNRGRGLENPVDKGHICGALGVCTEFIRSAAKAHLYIFPGADSEISIDGRRALFEDVKAEEDL